MSIRIHQLATKIGKSNKELMALLRERKIIGEKVTSPSGTISDIYAEDIAKEFGVSLDDPAPTPAPPVSAAPATPPPTPEAASTPPKVVLPAGVFVKTAQDIAREKAEKEAAAKAALAAARPAVSPPVTLTPRSVAAPPRAPALLPPPRLAPPPVRAPVSAPPPISRPPLTPRLPEAVPTPVEAARSPAVPPPIMRAPAVPPLPPRVSAAPRPPPTPAVVPVVTRRTDASGAEVKIIQMKPPIIVRDLAAVLGVKPFKLISEVQKATGGFASMNLALDEPVAAKLAEAHGFLLEVKHRGETPAPLSPKDKEAARQLKAAEEEAKNLAPRPPVVCILGHVDHGKTSLLDAIRKASVAAGEAGGITQHIGAYQIEHHGKKITFLDTPGHAAFNKMRARGASVTDIAVLVVAADDGFMPQTDEALSHAQNANVTLMVAVNKMDVKGANIDRVKTQMQDRKIAPEDWGGDTVTVPVSALKGTGLSELLDMILLQAEVLELKANPKADPAGIIIESQVDVGRGPLATVIVQRGTLRPGDTLVCGPAWCKVRALYDDQGKNLKEAPPAAPVRVIGWSGTPDSGSSFRSVKNAREAEKLADEELQRLKKEAAAAHAAKPVDVSVAQLFANIAAVQQKTLKVVIKADVFGSTEAVRQVLEGIKSTKVSLEIVSVDVGLVTKNDVLMAAAAGGATIIGFNTKLENGVTPLAKHHGVRIESFSIIYEMGDKVREMMADLLDPDLKETKTGAAEVRATFAQGKGFVAGCLITEGKVTRNSAARVRRKKEILTEGKVATLKRFKDDATEVRAGLECGIKIGDFNDYQPGDIIECYEIQKVRAAL
jgi:translation initiation factor IF-2